MQNTYHFLKFLSSQLEQEIKGMTIETCFTQSKDELMIGLVAPGRDFYIKAHLRNFLPILCFSDSFQRARRNSTDLFEGLIGAKVIKIVQHPFERSFHLELEGFKQLLFKMHGTRANIIYFESGKAVELLHHSMQNDLEISLLSLQKEIEFSEARFIELEGDLKAFAPTFDKQILKHFELNGYSALNLADKWLMFLDVYHELNKGKFYILKTEQAPEFSLLKSENVLFETNNALEICNKYMAEFGAYYHFHTERNTMFKILEKRIVQLKNYIENNTQKYFELAEAPSPQTFADVIMANLHAIPAKTLEVSLFNFYTNQEEKFSFKPNVSPQKTAEGLYRKAKNRKKELDKIQENIQIKEAQKLEFEQQKSELESLLTLKEVRSFANKFGFNEEKNAKEAPEPQEIFKVFQYEGFRILMGRNAKNNDLLTLHYAHKDDLWLHARDVSGSHVIIKHQSGKSFPAPVIEFAATLAAWNSKRRTDSLCPVIVTHKKFVRKPKGMGVGQVLLEKEEQVVMVVPKDVSLD